LTTDLDAALAKADATFRKRWEEGQYERAQQYDLFPLVFQERIDGFRARRPDTFWRMERIEFFCCSEAVKIINHLGTTEEIENFAKLSLDAQERLIPEIEYRTHTVDTFLMTIRLAWTYRKDSTLVPKAHSVCCALTGCELCGCWATVAETN